MSNLKDELREIIGQTQDLKVKKNSLKSQDDGQKMMNNVCEKCKGLGWYFIDYNTVRECECGILEIQRQESKLSFATIPETYKDIRIEDWKRSFYSNEFKPQAKTILESVKGYLEHITEFEEQGKGFFFWSETKGSGKTMMAAAIANELITKYRRFAKFATSLDILDEIKSTFNSHSEETESKLLSDLARADFLIIDDFGTERVTDWVGEKFYQIINGRYINKKVTLFTSNHDLNTLRYDERVKSRIKERSFMVHFPEQSVREVKAFRENRGLSVE